MKDMIRRYMFTPGCLLYFINENKLLYNLTEEYYEKELQ